MELNESTPPVKDDRKQLEDRDTTCGMICGSSVAVPEETDGLDNDLDNVDGPLYPRVKKTIHWVSVMDGLQRVLIFADDENLSFLARKVGIGFGSNVIYFYRSVFSNDTMSQLPYRQDGLRNTRRL